MSSNYLEGICLLLKKLVYIPLTLHRQLESESRHEVKTRDKDFPICREKNSNYPFPPFDHEWA